MVRSLKQSTCIIYITHTVCIPISSIKKSYTSPIFHLVNTFCSRRERRERVSTMDESRPLFSTHCACCCWRNNKQRCCRDPHMWLSASFMWKLQPIWWWWYWKWKQQTPLEVVHSNIPKHYGGLDWVRGNRSSSSRNFPAAALGDTNPPNLKT